jgi:hypothetical protein
VETTNASQKNDAPTAAALITHRVESYDAWRPFFDGDQSARVRAGILGHHVNRSADDPNTVSVYLPAPSQDALRRFAESPELKTVMAKAGVISQPVVVPLTPREDSTVKRPAAGAIVIHEVKDYDAWKKLFDAHGPTRTKAGIIGHAVNQRADNPNIVVVYLQADTLDALRAFASSADLKDTMQRAGVVAPPEIHFVQGQDWAAYA